MTNTRRMQDDLLTKTKYSQSIKWQERVYSMSDRQIVAVWHRINNAKEWITNEKK